MRGFGKHLIINLSGGSGYQLKTDEQNIRDFIDELCTKIDMKKHGLLILDWFGENNVEGWSAVQLISTSNITGHFCGEYEEYPETSNTAYIDVFSCKDFEKSVVIEVINKYFNPDCINSNMIIRERPQSKEPVNLLGCALIAMTAYFIYLII